MRSVHAQTPSGTQIVNVANAIVAFHNGQKDTTKSNLASIIVQGPGKLVLSKTVSQTNIRVGDTVLYRILVSNIGNTALTNVRIVDTLSTSLSFVSPTSGTRNGNVLSWKFDTLKAVSADTVFVKAKIVSTVPNNTFIRNYAFGFYDQGEKVVDSVPNRRSDRHRLFMPHGCFNKPRYNYRKWNISGDYLSLYL